MSCGRLQRQGGSSLIEAMIGALLMGILMVGLTSVLVRTLSSQRYMNAQNYALLEIRAAMQAEGGIADICDNSVNTVPIGSHQATMSGANCTASAALSDFGIAGVTEDLDADAATIGIEWKTAEDSQNAGLFGGDGVITVSY